MNPSFTDQESARGHKAGRGYVKMCKLSMRTRVQAPALGKKSKVWYVFEPSAGEAEPGRSLGLAGQAA